MMDQPMPPATASLIAELAGYVGAVARLQAFTLFNVTDAEMTRNAEAVLGPSVSDCARAGELVGRLSFDIVELAEQYGLAAEQHNAWIRSRSVDFTAEATRMTKADDARPAASPR